MTDQAKKYVSDILTAIRLIEEFTKETETFEAYQSSMLIKSVVERQLGIIGEAVKQFQKLGESFELTSAKQIVIFRNRIIHSYDKVDDTIVWAILKRYLPVLKAEAINGINK